MTTRLWLSGGGGLLALLVMASAALAQTPADVGYGGQGGNVQQDVGGEGVASGALPFTGMDLALMAVAAGLLIATGLVIRRVARAKTVAS